MGSIEILGLDDHTDAIEVTKRKIKGVADGSVISDNDLHRLSQKSIPLICLALATFRKKPAMLTKSGCC